MELNDTTDYQRCFVCGQRNAFGLHLVFRLEGDSVVADFQPHEEHQGFPGVIHGGIVAALLDEALGRTSLLGNNQEWTMTGRLEVRYRHYVPYGPLLRVRARLGIERRRMMQASGVLTLADNESAVLAEAQGTFLPLAPQVVDTIMQDFPELRNFMNTYDIYRREGDTFAFTPLYFFILPGIRCPPNRAGYQSSSMRTPGARVAA